MLCCVAASLAQSPRLRLINFLRERNINRGINNKFYNALEEFFTEELTGGNPGGEDGGDDGGSDQFGLGDGNGGSDNGGNGGNEGNTNNCPLCAGAPVRKNNRTMAFHMNEIHAVID